MGFRSRLAGFVIPFKAPSSSRLACPIVFVASVICFSIHEKESSEDMQIAWKALDICFLPFLSFDNVYRVQEFTYCRLVRSVNTSTSTNTMKRKSMSGNRIHRERRMLFDCKASVDMQTKFQSFNELYFHGSLPKYRILVCSKARKKRFERAYAAGFCSSKKRDSNLLECNY